MSKTTFSPEIFGFHFGNGFTNHEQIQVFGASIATFTTYGRCGGMAAAALDYYHIGCAAPVHTADDFAPDAVPADGTPLADYIKGRLFDSFDLYNVARFVTMTVSLDHSTLIALPPADNRGTPRVTKQDEIPKLRAQLDLGNPVVLGLVGANNLLDIGSKNHQVVAYDYVDYPQAGTIEISIYDCNNPDRNCGLQELARSRQQRLRARVGPTARSARTGAASSSPTMRRRRRPTSTSAWQAE